jgi:hypothetical protein
MWKGGGTAPLLSTTYRKQLRTVEPRRDQRRKAYCDQ